jgi:hypothetical protein
LTTGVGLLMFNLPRGERIAPQRSEPGDHPVSPAEHAVSLRGPGP